MAVPKLRFPEFTDNWDNVETGDIFDNITDKGYTDKIVLTIVQGVGTVHREDSGRNMIFDESSINAYKRVEPDDFIIHLRSFEGGLEKANEEGVISPAYTVLRAKDKVTTVFLYNYFHTNKFINSVLAKAVEGIRDGRQISYNMFKWLKMPYPSYREQQKIADFLTTFDKRITAQKNIIADLEEIKKGLLQKIFSQEIRFKADDGSKFPAWETKKLGEVFTERSERLKDISMDLKLLSVSIANGVTLQTESEKRNIESADNSNYKVVYKGDLAYNSMRMWQGACGASSYDGYVSPAYTVLKTEHNVKFWAEYFKSDYSMYKSRINSQGLTSDTWNLKYPLLKNIKYDVPSLPEQRKIADFLSFFDKKIEAETKILEELKKLKKGLLQQMFV